jgi:hypothetical protein
MKWRWRIILGLIVIILAVALISRRGSGQAERRLKATRLALRKEKFKLDLAEFNISVPDEVRKRMPLLGTTTRQAMTNNGSRQESTLHDSPRLMTPAGSNAVTVFWRQERLATPLVADSWPELRSYCEARASRLNLVAQAALAGAICFEPIDREGPMPLYPYLAGIKSLEVDFGYRTMLALRDGRNENAWTNLLAATCLVTSYMPDPGEIAYQVRFGCAAIAFEITWNALQTNVWTPSQLAQLQQRWESVDFWNGLPETAAYVRASGSAMFKLEREQSTHIGFGFKDFLRSPKDAWPALKHYAERVHYRSDGIFEDERLFLLYERERELELRKAIGATSWLEMRQMPGVTSEVPFATTNRSRTVSRLNLWQMHAGGTGSGKRLLARAAEAEARKRLLVQAIALERYRAKHHSYPSRLEELAPEFLSGPLLDFMDGGPARYRRDKDGHFVLYSVGLDGKDDGGQLPMRSSGQDFSAYSSRGSTRPATSDLVWPRPASEDETRQVAQEAEQKQAAEIAVMENFEANVQWERTARRQRKAELLLKASRPSSPSDVVYRKGSLSQTLANLPATATNKPILLDLLSLEQVVTGEEPETVTFELPIKYDALTNVGNLGLLVDPVGDDDSDEVPEACHYELRRATNGNCRMAWSTIYETPGKHALAAVLELNSPERSREGIMGPCTAFLVTNLCQFSLSSAHFDRKRGADFRIRIPEPNGGYAVTMKSPEGKNLRTITGSADDYLIYVHWDLKDETGKLCTNDSFDSVVEINLPASGRSQRMKGP